MVKALLDREDCNVIFVDWFNGATLLYAQAAGNTRLVGVQIAVLIEFIISTYRVSPDVTDRFYIIGFSLGAQIAGHAGRHLRENNMVLGRITGKIFSMGVVLPAKRLMRIYHWIRSHFYEGIEYSGITF